MSASLSQRQQTWCDTARNLVEAKQKPTAGTARLKLNDLRDMLMARPPELTDAELQSWNEKLDVIVAATKMGDGKKDSAPLPSMAMGNLKEFIDNEVPKLQALVAKREVAYSQVQTDKAAAFNQLSTTGKEALRRYDDPGAELAKIQALRKDANPVGKDLMSLTNYLDAGVRTTKMTTLKSALDALDLAKSKASLKDLKAFLVEANAEKAQVNELESRHQDHAGAPTDLNGWRELAKANRDFDDVKDDIETLLNQIADPASGVPQSKQQQATSLTPEIETQFENWQKDVTDIATKLDSGNKLGSLGWFRERLQRLQAPTAQDASTTAAAAALKDWSDFLADVSKRWKFFTANGGNRGTTGDQAILARKNVKNKIAVINGFSAGGATWTKSNSDSAGMSFHTPLPQKYLDATRPHMKSFIYHLKEYEEED
jgi:hypothetical protein